jgi:hypothetical protein
MKTHTTISGSELLLGVIAIRLAVLVVVGWSLTLLPQQVRDTQTACTLTPAAGVAAQLPAKAAGRRIADAAFDDMRLHD